jgi:hypothetical protein
MDSGKGLYREHRGVDIAVHAREIEKGKWVPRTVLFEPTIGDTRELGPTSPPDFGSEEEALEAGMRMALEAVDRMHVPGPGST